MTRHIILIVNILYHESYLSTLQEKIGKASQSTVYRTFIKDRTSSNYQDTLHLLRPTQK